MLARRFESLLAEETGKTDLSQRAPDDIPRRFESLRGYRLLPTGRTKNVTHLTLSQIATAILSVATVKPGYAGLAGTILTKLHAVGGVDASFHGCVDLGGAVERLIESPTARESLLELRISDSEIYTNAHCRGAIIYSSGDAVAMAHYVGHTAVSLLQPGAEKGFNHRELISSVITEIVFYSPFFRRIANELKREASAPRIPVAVPPEDEDEEARKEDRAKHLGLLPNSRFLNLGVDNQITWPHEETVVNFEGYKLVMLPKTAQNTTSIHIDLAGQRINSETAVTLINRLLSLMSWCDDQFAILQEGWSGNPAPVPVRKRDLGFTTAYTWIFDRKVPKSPEARKALAIYREARNAEENYLISYAVLSYYKIVELKHRGKSEARRWFETNYTALKDDQTLADELARFEAARGTEKPGDYLYRACRVAVAHANKPFSSDPDDISELRRLHVAANILRALARRFIQTELSVSECPYDGS
ncbi:MAG TPA: methylamine utilization protein MauJ [Xanthobacteraceae bacterium]|jgi:hypothetical protein|nr:methylamine utilization protein MauJ [Xanthobacteraceae bacterium]